LAPAINIRLPECLPTVRLRHGRTNRHGNARAILGPGDFGRSLLFVIAEIPARSHTAAFLSFVPSAPFRVTNRQMLAHFRGHCRINVLISHVHMNGLEDKMFGNREEKIIGAGIGLLLAAPALALVAVVFVPSNIMFYVAMVGVVLFGVLAVAGAVMEGFLRHTY
jgi:hypothetical protein